MNVALLIVAGLIAFFMGLCVAWILMGIDKQ